MGVLRWFIKNWANTTEPTHPDLRPAPLPDRPDRAVSRVAVLIDRVRGWRVESSDPAGGTVHATRRTRVFGFVDDVRLRFEPDGDGCRVHAESRSRVGRGDFGQNRRNILELWAALQRLRA